MMVTSPWYQAICGALVARLKTMWQNPKFLLTSIVDNSIGKNQNTEHCEK